MDRVFPIEKHPKWVVSTLVVQVLYPLVTTLGLIGKYDEAYVQGICKCQTRAQAGASRKRYKTCSGGATDVSSYYHILIYRKIIDIQILANFLAIYFAKFAIT